MNTVDTENEMWYDIEGFKGIYQISNFLRVRSFQLGNPAILTIGKNADGYLRVQLSIKRKKKIINIHQLSAKMFVANPNNYKEINHKDNDRANPHPSNLEWCTRSYNITHAYRLGNKSIKGELNGNSILTESLVLEIMNCRDRNNIIASKYGVSHVLISDIKRGKAWNHVTGIKFNPKRQLYKEEILHIFYSLDTILNLSIKFNMSTQTIRMIKNGKKHSLITGKKYIAL